MWTWLAVAMAVGQHLFKPTSRWAYRKRSATTACPGYLQPRFGKNGNLVRNTDSNLYYFASESHTSLH